MLLVILLVVVEVADRIAIGRGDHIRIHIVRLALYVTAEVVGVNPRRSGHSRGGIGGIVYPRQLPQPVVLVGYFHRRGLFSAGMRTLFLRDVAHVVVLVFQSLSRHGYLPDQGSGGLGTVFGGVTRNIAVCYGLFLICPAEFIITYIFHYHIVTNL